MEVDEVFDLGEEGDEMEEEEFQIQIPDSIPVCVLNSSLFEGKGVFPKKPFAAGEELWEEDPLFSWTIRPDPVRSFLLRHSSVKHPQSKRRKVVENDPLKSSGDSVPSLVFSLAGPRVYEMLPSSSSVESCCHCLAPLVTKGLNCDCGDVFCTEECQKKALTYSHLCFPSTEEVKKIMREMDDFQHDYSAFSSGQISFSTLLLTYIHIIRKYQEFIDMECDEETSAYCAMCPLAQFVTAVDSLCPKIDYEKASDLLLKLLKPHLPEGLLKAAPSLFSPSDVKERLGQLALNSHACALDPILSSSSSSSLGDPRGGGLYTILGCVNHSCSPNCEVVLSSSRTIMIRAVRSIAEDEELTISYINDKMDFKERQQKLFHSFLIAKCICPLCSKERKGE